MQLSRIADILGNTLSHDDRSISWLLTDSRLLAFPAETLFFALVTQRNNGHRYIRGLYERGVRAFVVSEQADFYAQMPDAEFMVVVDVLRALQKVAAVHRNGFSIPVIGITGSNGKTIVKEWLFQLLHSDHQITRSPRSYNSQTGVPLSVWQLNHSSTLGIFEAGISQPGEMAHLQQIIKPDTGIFTSIGDAHQEFFPDIETKIREKALLFAESDQLIFRSDNALLNKVLPTLNIKAGLISWGKNSDATLRILNIATQNNKTDILLEAKQQKFTVCVPFSDEASIENAMHCVTLMWLYGYDTELINSRLQLLEPVAMRLELKEGKNGCIIINDSYNSDLNALGIALDMMRQQADTRKMKTVLLLSDILQSGLNSDGLYAEVARLLASRKVDCLLGVGGEICRHASLFDLPEQHFYATTEAVLTSQRFENLKDEVVLLKGSRPFRFEDLSSRLELIVHETRMEVNLNALIDNFNYFRAKLQQGTRVMCMVKAFGYGSGSVEIARTLQHHGCDALAVAVADEGAELRNAGIHIPVVVMNPEKSAFNVLFEHHLEPEIYSMRLLHDFVEAAARLGITSYPVHIKIDSGMHRLGFDPSEIDELIRYLQNQQEVQVRSVFSHLAGSDNPALDYFTATQAEVFQHSALKIRDAFSHQIMFHLLNSAGVERFACYQHDLVRLGIGLYGVSALPEQQLRQVCKLKTIILQLKKIAAGETVGYNRNGKADGDKLIAILPLGYADGFDRKLGNGLGEVFVGGRRAPVIGNVSMDLTAVDVTGMQVQEGDTVEIFGDAITISGIASKIDTIPYEILTGISRRVKRVYIQE
jgi:Alr-MurF fusion protein